MAAKFKMAVVVSTRWIRYFVRVANPPHSDPAVVVMGKFNPNPPGAKIRKKRCNGDALCPKLRNGQ